MKKFKRKAVAIALSLAMLFSILPASGAFAADGNQVQEGVPQTETAGEQQEIPAETEGGEMQTQEASVPQLQYLYIDTPYLMTPDTQKIMVSFQDEIELESVSMVYENVETAEQYEVLAGEIQDATAVFSIDYLENSTAGSYHLLKVRTVSGGITNEIDLGEAGIDSRFGVNQECDTQPDAIVEEESTSSSARTVNEPGNPVNFLTYDEEGELVESESVEEAVEEAKTDVPAMASRAAETSEKAGNLIVVIDPGHGGYDPGAVGVNGAKEKDLTLKIAKYCKEELEKYSGVTVYMTRTTDTGLSPSNNLSDDLKKRVEYAKGKKADVLVSMHLNSTGLGTAHGAEVYYPNANYNPGVGSEGKNLASKIQKELVGLGLTDRGIKIRNSGTNTLYPDGSLQDYYALIWQSKRAGFPAIIVEHAFIDNTSDYNKYLSSDEKLKALGIADAKGIAEAYGFAKGQWIQNDKGWWYQYADGSYAKNTWAAINGAWYHFDSDGYMQTGWFTEGTAKYYLDPVSGAMKTGWQLINNKWYYFNGSGIMVTGWQWIGNTCYYFDGTGVMETDTWIGNDYVNSNGAWVPGKVKEEAKWILDGRGWWYRHSDGSYTKSNWEVIGGQWYYFDAAGYMVTGWQWIGGKCYYFASSGAMASNTWIGNDYVDASGAWVPGKVKEEAKWILDGRGWWYRHKDGSYTRSNWEVIGGQWYYFDADGYMVTGWIALGGTHYYLNTSGAMHKGWLKDNGTWYYLNPTANNFGAEGAMTRGYRQIDGVWYYFNKEISPEGAMTYEGVTPIMGATALGNKTTAVNKMVKMYMNSKRTYPSGALSKGGASNITQFCEILYEEAIVENVKPEVVFGQAMKETGYLQFGGDVKVEQFNFAGLGATGGVPGESFKDVRTGIRAQVQHLKAYASKDSPKNEIVDTRFAYVTRNCAPYVEWLGIKENPDGKGWATARKYGMSLMESYIKPIYGM